MSLNVLDRETATREKSRKTGQKKKYEDFQFERIPVKGYEQVIKITNPKTKLLAIVAIHNTELGPTLGGTRIQSYASFDTALEDALRLAKGMTYKSAIAEVGLGGAKSVIIADPQTEKTEKLLKSFGEAINYFEGRYTCAEDMGCSTKDAAVIRKSTPYVVGLESENSSGNPAPFTAWGTYKGIEAACQKLYGTASLEGRTIAVQGLGNVGSELVRLLFWSGADLILADPDPEKLEKIAKKYKAKIVGLDEIYEVECDVFAPCAMGAVINDKTLPKLNCKAIAGCANNQLHKKEHGDALFKKGILYAPDFVINAGGLINVIGELSEEGYNPKISRDKTTKIYDRLLSIFEISEKNQVSTNTAAISLAEYRIKYGIGKRVYPLHFSFSSEE